jgi:hypothetical protein
LAIISCGAILIVDFIGETSPEFRGFIWKTRLSVPAYALPAKSVPETVAVVELIEVETVHA